MKEKGLELLRQPFLPEQINKLPKPTKAQSQCPASEKIKCKICGGWHHPKVVHLDYVGHAAATNRLLDADTVWSWEPLAYADSGLPLFDETGGLWIKLTVCGHTRLGYGHAEKSQYKEIGSRIKEVVGDALRNAGMRFGMALDLWHKGAAPLNEDIPEPKKPYADYIAMVDKLKSKPEVETWIEKMRPEIKENLSSLEAGKLKTYCIQIMDILSKPKNDLGFLLTELGKIETKENLIKFERAFDPQINGLDDKAKELYGSESAIRMTLIQGSNSKLKIEV